MSNSECADVCSTAVPLVHRCRGCVIILSLIGLVLGLVQGCCAVACVQQKKQQPVQPGLGFMCGFLMSFLGCLDGDAGVCATGLTFAVIFVISLVSCLLEFKPLLRRVELREQMSRTGFASTQFLVHNDCVKLCTFVVIQESESFSLVTKLMKRQRVLVVHVLPKVWLLPFCRWIAFYLPMRAWS